MEGLNGSDQELFAIIEEDFPALYKELSDDIENFNRACEVFGDIECDSYDGDALLFGFDSPIQEHAGEMDSPIMVFGSFRNCISDWTADYRTDIYGDGSGSIYIKFGEDGKPDYYFYGSR